jgi:hypothetical protein
MGAQMRGHGWHWGALYEVERYATEVIDRDIKSGRLVCQAPCVDVVNGSDRREQVVCLRRGSERIANQILVVTDTSKGEKHLFSGYPVLLDGIAHQITVERVDPWQHGIEAWVHARATSEEVPIVFFDTMYFVDHGVLKPGAHVTVSLAALAYSLEPIKMRSFEISHGPLWEIERDRRLAAGASPGEAARPMTFRMEGAAIFIPRGGDDAPDDAEFQGRIEALEVLEHDGRQVYRLAMVVMRPGDESFRLPVFASTRALRGYLPRVGDDVQGTLWLQGRVLTDARLTP